MGKEEKFYSINVHYPDGKDEIMALRNNMGAAYAKFVKDYILNLPIKDEDKNNLYSEVIEQLTTKGQSVKNIMEIAI